MAKPKLYMAMLGCKPQGRNTEQHDIFFGIGHSVKDLVPAILEFWPEAKGKIHLDAYREVKNVDGYEVSVIDKSEVPSDDKLFFLNLGGYQPNVFDEIHYQVLCISPSQNLVVKAVKSSDFFKQFSSPHVDDKYGLDVDDIFDVEDILSDKDRLQYSLSFTPAEGLPADEIVLGYMPIDKLK